MVELINREKYGFLVDKCKTGKDKNACELLEKTKQIEENVL